ncbi:hypothetical protein Avbf_08956 [Armadillidium vulgare]|nr:hypothetical protein Avbf_08956 [Armadillidium vulgare]
MFILLIFPVAAPVVILLDSFQVTIAAHQVLPFGSSHFYTGTKFAVRALSEGLRQELQAANSGIKLSVVSPGLVKTEFVNQMTETPEFAK